MLSRHLGLSLPATRRRLEALSYHFNGAITGKIMKGPRGKILVGANVAELLRDAENLARERRITFTEALQIVAGDHSPTAQTSREAPAKMGERIANGDQVLARAVATGAGLIARAVLVAGVLIALALQV